ncbi:MAG: hypothetical protein KDD47_25790 [Acidobacteria bacterium]|nr:hypothetical protein [Acidobacteriota bacterium]
MIEDSTDGERRVWAVIKANATVDPLDDLVAHIRAVDAGPAVLPVIQEALFKIDWSRPTPRGKVGLLTALMLVAHDVDEKVARSISADLTSCGSCHPLFRQRLKSICQLTVENFQEYHVRGLRLFVSRDLLCRPRVAAYLNDWLEGLPEQDVAGIRRIYIVERKARKFWGEYLRVLSNITLVWRGWNAQSVRERLATEYTLYHEIGHHVHRHQGPGSGESEALADSYALSRFAKAHPLIGNGALGAFTIAFAVGKVRKNELPELDDYQEQ